ncbi:hypothetical protein B0T25DRAFT_459192 [Lasiosphaeria hispida]|uniref:FAD-binding FR-type domain-containing protein n=1 Tax=Lasiosphaeria hispida TaxID=260671 RepID=A0AAJ0HF23_9PEZI|nr:hypothetical protein B0T25DRAFT_459192 [Lasiosphaeria hispida]
MTTHNGWHPGERAVHALLHVPTASRPNPTAPGLPPQYGYRLAASSLVALGTVDSGGRVWTTVWGGERGFARAIAKGVIGVQSDVGEGDPVVESLLASVAGADGVVRPEGRVAMAGLGIDLETRDRVKIAGRMLVGARVGREVQLGMVVEESLGNCPKYINRKAVRPNVAAPRVVSKGTPVLPGRAVGLVGRADMFFLSSTDGRTMDTNHRGGPRGFVRVVRNDEGGVVLVYPEYSGNRLYQTLGNLHENPRVGVAIPDFASSDVLYLTGETELLVGPAAAALMPHAKLVVKIVVHEARFVENGLPFRADDVEPSPYNPAVRPLACEHAVAVPGQGDVDETAAPASAALVKREVLTPNVARFTFKLRLEKGRSLPLWKPGQHVTLDFADELDHGWSHMRDNDPQSLNDDFVRTFTVSNPPPLASEDNSKLENGTELQITVRKHGPTTRHLWRQNVRASLELPVLGFGGEESFRLPTNGEKKAVFIAGGVGITPLLAQAPRILATTQQLSLLWTLRAEDLGLGVDTLERLPGLAEGSKLFVTGGKEGSEKEAQLVKKIEDLGAQVVLRRFAQDDVLAARDAEKGTKYYLCTNPELLKAVQGWLGGEDLVTESFNY